MVTPYDPSKTITKMFIQIDKGLQIINAENTPFANSQIIDKVCIFLQNTVLYSEGFRAWYQLPTAEKCGLTFSSTYIKPTKM